MLTILRIASVVVSIACVAHAQERNLRQLANAHRGHVDVMEFGCGWAGPPLGGIVNRADIAVEGIVLSVRTYSTPDDRDIYTDYEIATSHVILHRVTFSNVPRTMTFKSRGGTVELDGYPVTLTVNGNGRRVDLEPGDHVIMFGRYDKTDGKWDFTPVDYFDVRANVVVNTLPTLDQFPEGLQPEMTMRDFIEKVRALAARRK